ncbi:MAG TPA: hypothetical protein VFB63_00290 [Bryobacteraceae bacterium]|nr:hypothetical protein [Bryobacteraceae bacterium]
MAEHLTRYLAGEHEAVWAELTALGERIHEPGIREDAQAVASEVMRRATQNLRTLAARLEELGYQFESFGGGSAPFAGMDLDFGALQSQFGNMAPEAQKKMGGQGMVKALQSLVGFLQKAPPAPARKMPAVEPAPAGAKKTLKEIEEILDGSLPLSLRAWYEHADGVSFMGVHHELNPSQKQGPPTILMPRAAFSFPGGKDVMAEQKEMAAKMGFRLATEVPPTESQPLPDPIVMMPLEELLNEIEGCAEEGFPGPIAFAPDDLHKADISGDTWDMELPCAGADAPFGRWPGFVPYLREVCAWGGFPGWSHEVNPPRDQIAFLTKDLLQF